MGPDGKVVAIDPDVDRLMLARKKYPATNLEYHVGCAEDLPGRGYDVIFSNEFFYWVKDLDCVFQKHTIEPYISEKCPPIEDEWLTCRICCRWRLWTTASL